MTITSTTSRWEAVGNGSTTVFPYNNKIFADADLKVYLDGVLQTLTTHYTVSGAGTDGGGNVTFLTAPATGVDVVIVRDVPNTQLIDYPAAGAFPSIATEDGLDKRTIISQQQASLFQRALRYLESDSNVPSAELPTLETLKGRYLRFSSSTGAPEAGVFETSSLVSGEFLWAGTAGGTANALTLSPTPPVPSYAAGLSLGFIPSTQNTGAVTVAVSGLAAKSVKFAGAALGAAQLDPVLPVRIVYDGADFNVVSGIVDGTYRPRPVTAPAIVKNVGDWQRRNRDLLDFAPAATPSDWASTLQTAITETGAAGGKLKIPAGSYTLGSEVDLDQSAFLNYGQNLQVVLEGDGSSNTAFIVDHAGAAINIFGGTLGVPRTTIRGLKFRGSGLRNGIGIIGDNLAHCAFEDLLFNNLDVGFEFTDLLSSVFYNIQSKWNNYGGRFNGRVNLSPHNAIDMFRCQFGNNSEYGLYAKNIAVFNFFGGSIEGNGITGLGTTGQRFGMKIEEPNANGDMPALNMNGTWFEHNAGTADLFLLMADAGQYSQWNIERCLFTRVTSAEFVDYAIRIDLPSGAGHAHVEAHGNSFAGYGTYVPDAARPYIKTFVSGGSISFAGRNNFKSDVEAPTEFATNQVYARCTFNGTLASPLVVRGNNVASITKNATGDYTITFNRASNFPTKSLAVTLNGQGVGYKFSASTTTVRIRTADLAGTLTDFSDITVLVWD